MDHPLQNSTQRFILTFSCLCIFIQVIVKSKLWDRNRARTSELPLSLYELKKEYKPQDMLEPTSPCCCQQTAD